MIKTGDHYINITFTTNIRDRATKLLTMTYNLYIILLSIYQFSSTLLNCKRTVSLAPAGPKNICNVSPTTWQSGAGNPLMLKLLKVTPPPTTKTDPSEVPPQSKRNSDKTTTTTILLWECT